jgi:hypothetical protein
MYARSLSRLALVFVVLYVLLVIFVAIPPRLLDYEWIQRVTATMINGSSMPLLALLVLVVGCQIYPDHELLSGRRQLFSRLAGVAVLGFLLLIPLHIYMGLLQQTGTSDQVRALAASERQLNAYRQAASQATSLADLQARLAKLGAPAINPEILARPLPEVKAQAAASFNQVAGQIAEQRKALSDQSSWITRAPEVLRIVVACLILAFGFAAFAQPTPTGPLLIDGFEDRLAHLRRKSLFRSGKTDNPMGQAALLLPLTNLLQSLHGQSRAHHWRQRNRAMSRQISSAPLEASTVAEGEDNPPSWWRRLFAGNRRPPAKSRNASRASGRGDHDDYIQAILSKDSEDS